MDLISVIVPVYRVEKYLKRCVESIAGQTYQNLEIILVEDGSPDRCGEMCDRFAKEDRRIRVLHQKNGGLSAARNAGIEAAKGAFLAFVDSDDFIAEDFIAALYEALVSTASEIAQCKYEYVAGNQMTKAKEPGTIRVLTGKQMLVEMYDYEGAYNVVAWNKLYKSSLFQEIRYPNGKIHEDEATSYRLFYQAERVAFLDRYLYGYFTSPSSITRNEFKRNRLDWAWALEGRMVFYREKEEQELLRLTLKAYIDGVIALYQNCRSCLPDSSADQKELLKKVKAAKKELKQCGGVSFRTNLGYFVFLAFPAVYCKIRGKNGAN